LINTFIYVQDDTAITPLSNMESVETTLELIMELVDVIAYLRDNTDVLRKVLILIEEEQEKRMNDNSDDNSDDKSD